MPQKPTPPKGERTVAQSESLKQSQRVAAMCQSEAEPMPPGVMLRAELEMQDPERWDGMS